MITRVSSDLAIRVQAGPDSARARQMTRTRGRASCAICGSRRPRRAGGSTAATALSRYYSHYLALQLKGRMEGIPTPPRVAR
jgi:hypothetical protein